MSRDRRLRGLFDVWLAVSFAKASDDLLCLIGKIQQATLSESFLYSLARILSLDVFNEVTLLDLCSR